MNKIQSIATLLLCLLASACSLTRNLPEGETLYRGIKSIDTVLTIIEDSAGTQFDPNLARIFVGLKDELQKHLEDEDLL